MGETWKPIPGYEGLYEASDLGRIRTAEGKTTSSARFPVRVWKQRVLKPKVQNRRRGDHRVDLWKDGSHRTYLVARLVASAFYGIPMDGYTVNHKNGIPSDNRAENLEWCTIGENIHHGLNTGLYESMQKPITLTKGNEQLRFPSMASASRFLGHQNGYVSCRVCKGYAVLYSVNGEQYGYL